MKTVLLLALAYVVVMGALYALQRKLQYHPFTDRVTPESAGLTHIQEVELVTQDKTRLINWYVPPRDGAPVILFFHGNGGAIWSRKDRIEAYRQLGFGVFFHSYRGYAGSGGSPSEEGLVSDGIHVVDWLKGQGIGLDKLIIIGESLGTGVAVQVAVQRTPAALILEAPFSSAADIGAKRYPWLPVKYLMWDQFESHKYVDRVKAPITIFHGDKDTIVPIAWGRRLFQVAREPKQMLVIPGAGHLDLSEPEIYERQAEIIREVVERK